MKKLNLGCGEFKKNGYINVDISPSVNPDIIHDLNTFPYPFDNDEFDVIEVEHVLEHLEDPFKVMKELHRISKDNALVIIKVPHFSRGFTHPEHKRGFDVTFGFYFNPNFKGGYQGVEFVLKKIEMHWFGQLYLKKTILDRITFYICYIVGKFIDVFANLNPFLCSKIWCFWVGGFDEIVFHFITKKR